MTLKTFFKKHFVTIFPKSLNLSEINQIMKELHISKSIEMKKWSVDNLKIEECSVMWKDRKISLFCKWHICTLLLICGKFGEKMPSMPCGVHLSGRAFNSDLSVVQKRMSGPSILRHQICNSNSFPWVQLNNLQQRFRFIMSIKLSKF